LPTKENNPAVPNSVGEQVTPTHEAFEAGAKATHCHMREDEGKPTSDTKRFARFKGARKAVHQHERAIFDGRGVERRPSPSRDAAAAARYGKPVGGVEQLLDAGLWEPARSGGSAGRRDKRNTG
jgi:uncharacterized protein (DUF849 family)